MRSVWVIAKRELGSYFTSPVAYVFLVIFLLLAGFFTFTAGQFFERGEASLRAVFGLHPVGGGLPVPHHRRLQPGHRPACALGEPGLHRHGRRLFGGHALRRLPEGRDRYARPVLFSLDDRLPAVRHRRGAAQPMRAFLKKHEALVFSAVGLAALFLILVAANYLVSLQTAKNDLTEGKEQALSERKKKILRGLEAPVKLKLYISRGEQAMP